MIRLLAASFIIGALFALACATKSTEDTTRTQTPTTTATIPSNDAPSSPTAVSLPDGLTRALIVDVIDGDTIEVEIDGEEYSLRYIGIDAPETINPFRPVGCFGEEASARNKELVEGKAVGLEKDVSETDDFGRLLRYVWLPAESTESGQAEMVNAILVRDGYARARRYPPDVAHHEEFLGLQAAAQQANRGLWLWGAVCPSAAAATAPAGSGSAICDFTGTNQPAVKGNISSSSGEKIYHVPGQQDYDNTVITESKGERWFCTEADAIAAGWRKARA